MIGHDPHESFAEARGGRLVAACDGQFDAVPQVTGVVEAELGVALFDLCGLGDAALLPQRRRERAEERHASRPSRHGAFQRRRRAREVGLEVELEAGQERRHVVGVLRQDAIVKGHRVAGNTRRSARGRLARARRRCDRAPRRRPWRPLWRPSPRRARSIGPAHCGSRRARRQGGKRETDGPRWAAFGQAREPFAPPGRRPTTRPGSARRPRGPRRSRPLPRARRRRWGRRGATARACPSSSPRPRGARRLRCFRAARRARPCRRRGAPRRRRVFLAAHLDEQPVPATFEDHRGGLPVSVERAVLGIDHDLLPVPEELEGSGAPRPPRKWRDSSRPPASCRGRTSTRSCSPFPRDESRCRDQSNRTARRSEGAATAPGAPCRRSSLPPRETRR